MPPRSIREKLVGIYANFMGRKYDWHKRRAEILSAEFLKLNSEVPELNFALNCARENNMDRAQLFRKLAVNYKKSASILKRWAREIDSAMRIEKG
jgi:hypothetical protein